MHTDLKEYKINQIKQESDPLRQAQLISELKAFSAIQNKDIATLMNVKPSHISHLIRVLKLPEIVIDGYVSKQISFTHLIIISRLKSTEEIVRVYEDVLRKSLNIAQTEHKIREVLYQIKPDGEYIKSDKLKNIERRISNSLSNSTVTVIQTRIKAKVVIEMTGGLQATSEFLENIGSRFRKRLTKEEKASIKQLAHQDVLDYNP